jgi:hypothetical protein
MVVGYDGIKAIAIQYSALLSNFLAPADHLDTHTKILRKI